MLCKSGLFVSFTQKSLINKWKFSAFGSFNVYLSFNSNRTYASDAFSDGLPTMQKSKPIQPLKDLFKRRIARVGPMTVADYMQQSLTNPALGYYTTAGDIFGKRGDFITSPEISQMFGELVGVWCAHWFRQAHSFSLERALRLHAIAAETGTPLTDSTLPRGPPTLHIVELGPGRGTLAADILRTLAQLVRANAIQLQQPPEGSPIAPSASAPNAPPFNVALHLVELSPTLAQMQENTLCTGAGVGAGAGTPAMGDDPVLELLREYNIQSGVSSGNETAFRSARTRFSLRDDLPNVSVRWYFRLEDVPRLPFTVIIAHEFFDALPIHKFEKTENGWREVLIGFDKATEKFAYTVAPNETPACSFLKYVDIGARTHLELCALGGAIMQQVAMRISGETRPTDASSLSSSPQSQSPSPPAQSAGSETVTDALSAPASQEQMTQSQAQTQTAQASGSGAPSAFSPGGVGAALVVDYGYGSEQIPTRADTWRAFERHEVREPLAVEPGSADLTADVDFDFLARQALVVPGIRTWGPVTQSAFLKEMGIEFRLERLLQSAKSDEQRQQITSGYRKLTEKAAPNMGARFKVFAATTTWRDPLTQIDYDSAIPAGFETSK